VHTRFDGWEEAMMIGVFAKGEETASAVPEQRPQMA
jgi:hypothetical protein